MIQNKKVINVLYIIVYSILILFCGYFHEPWSDEAQSWLIARDANLHEIFFKYTSYEGCFPLWICILKICIFFNIQYKYIYIISSSIIILSVFFIVFNNNIETPIKYLIPINYWFFYQYGIIARNYSLMVLFFSILLFLYENRHSKEYKYIILLIFGSMINTYGMIISGILFLQFCIECLKKQKVNKLLCAITIMFYIFETITLFPKKDLLICFNFYDNIFINILMLFIRMITYQDNVIFQAINVSIIMWIIVAYLNLKKYKKINVFTIIISIMVAFFLTIRATNHHLGILFFIILIDIILNVSNVKDHKIIKLICVIFLTTYVLITAKSVYDDIEENYSGAYDMAKYIKENVESDEIYSIGYKCTSILPYFEENIFCNRKTTFYTWDYSNEDNIMYNYYEIFEEKNYNFLKELEHNPQYILLQKHNLFESANEFFQDTIENSNCYEQIYETDGKCFFKGSYNEDEGFILYKLK